MAQTTQKVRNRCASKALLLDGIIKTARFRHGTYHSKRLVAAARLPYRDLSHWTPSMSA